MSVGVRGLAAWMMAAALLLAGWVQAQDKAALTTDREKVSYMIGADVGRSISAAGPDLDFAAFERAIRNAFAGGKPLLSDDEARTVGTALVQRIGERAGKPAPGLAPGTKPPAVAKDKVGHMVGADVGRSLTSIQDQIDMAVFLQAVRTLMTSAKPLLTDAEMDQVRDTFSKRMDAREKTRLDDAARKNAEEGAAFLARNKAAKGVISTASGTGHSRLDRRSCIDAGWRQIPALGACVDRLRRTRQPAEHRAQQHADVRCRIAGRALKPAF